MTSLDTRPGVYLHNLGCQMNALDSERLLGLLEEDGYRSVAEVQEADLILVNTCSVRDHAEHKAYSLLGQYARQKRFHPGLIVGMIGCLAQREGERVLSRAPALDLVVGPGDLDAVPGIIRALREERRSVVAVSRASGRALGGSHRAASGRAAGGGPVAFVEVSHGCDRSCTFCIVPTVRGRETSRPPEEIVEEVRVLAGQGVREVVLLGQTVNSYGRHQTPRTSLAELLGRIDAVAGI
ncbi:MAG: radical SAM protein, partial [Planctomycetes bacterium]|nr:radical SAM protein [Planctomycetota bacterium]